MIRKWFPIEEDRRIERLIAERRRLEQIGVDENNQYAWDAAAELGSDVYFSIYMLPWLPKRVQLHCLERLGWRT